MNHWTTDEKLAKIFGPLPTSRSQPVPSIRMTWRERWLWVAGLAALIAVLLVIPALAEPIVGRASVIDGDTIDIHGERIRLNNIDAPEGQQTCTDAAGREYRCGQRAAEALATILSASQPTFCEPHGRDRYDRILATCQAGGIDVGAELLRQGWAVEYDRYSDRRYTTAEGWARRARAGMWQGDFTTPRQWRTEQRAASAAENAASAPAGCAIKGNINGDGERIYHSPGQEHYERTRIDESNGERWFCSGAGATAAGWRPARR